MDCHPRILLKLMILHSAHSNDHTSIIYLSYPSIIKKILKNYTYIFIIKWSLNILFQEKVFRYNYSSVDDISDFDIGLIIRIFFISMGWYDFYIYSS